MKVFVLRHNRKFHSWSMIDEPNVHQDLYMDTIAVLWPQQHWMKLWMY